MAENPKGAWLDVHVLVLDCTPKEWVTQCLDSIEAARALTPIPVALHVIPGVPGHIGQARALGYAQGTAPYVTQVDDDDYVLPEVFAKLAEAMTQHPSPDAIFVRENTVQNGKFIPGRQRHSMKTFRRELLIDHSKWMHHSDWHQHRALEQEGLVCVDIPDLLYVYRIHESPAYQLRKQHPAELLENFK